MIPGVVYGQDEDGNTIKTMIMVDQKVLAKELREKGTSFENTLYELSVNSETSSSKFMVTPRQTQFNPGKEHVYYAGKQFKTNSSFLSLY